MCQFSVKSCFNSVLSFVGCVDQVCLMDTQILYAIFSTPRLEPKVGHFDGTADLRMLVLRLMWPQLHVSEAYDVDPPGCTAIVLPQKLLVVILHHHLLIYLLLFLSNANSCQIVILQLYVDDLLWLQVKCILGQNVHILRQVYYCLLHSLLVLFSLYIFFGLSFNFQVSTICGYCSLGYIQFCNALYNREGSGVG